MDLYAFNKAKYPDLSRAANEAAARIYSSGLSIWNGRVQAGGNNVMANNAAAAFDDAELSVLDKSSDVLDQQFSQIIRLRQVFMADSRREILDEIYSLAERAKASGWNTSASPFRMNGPRPV